MKLEEEALLKAAVKQAELAKEKLEMERAIREMEDSIRSNTLESEEVICSSIWKR